MSSTRVSFRSRLLSRSTSGRPAASANRSVAPAICSVNSIVQSLNFLSNTRMVPKYDPTPRRLARHRSVPRNRTRSHPDNVPLISDGIRWRNACMA